MQFPKLANKFHYRSFDVNTLYAFFNVPKDKNRVDTHRALDDIMRDLNACRELAKEYLK